MYIGGADSRKYFLNITVVHMRRATDARWESEKMARWWRGWPVAGAPYARTRPTVYTGGGRSSSSWTVMASNALFNAFC